MSDSVIRVENLWKRYGLPLRPYLDRQFDKLRGKYNPDPEAYGPWALKDISFEVKQGESLGIVGKNGAGKSTLLKVLAGVSQPTGGSVKIYGRMFPMIELSAGMHSELTGRENIRLLGAVMGLSDKDIKAKTPDIEDFCELGAWLDKPVWQYSSGMQARLGFSVAVNVDAEILLIDEVLSVGDVNFQKKCLARMDELTDGGVTVLFVSHNPYAVERLCQTALYLQNGNVASYGQPSDILTAYFQESVVQADKQLQTKKQEIPDPDLRNGTGSMRVQEFTFHNPYTGAVLEEIKTGDALTIRTHLKVKEALPEFSLSLRIHDSAGTVISVMRLPQEARPDLQIEKDCYIDCRIESFNLMPGAYWIEFMAKELGGLVIDHVSYGVSFTVNGDNDIFQQTGNRGFAYLPAKWDAIEIAQLG